MPQGIARPGYQTSIDRAGYAIVTGGVLCGLLAAGLMATTGQSSTWAIVGVAVVGGVLAMMAITAVAAPVWIVMHITNRRRPRHAMLVGAMTGFVIFAASQTYGFGLADPPPSDAVTIAMRWISGFATSSLLALVAAIIGLAMWRVAYRRG